MEDRRERAHRIAVKLAAVGVAAAMAVGALGAVAAQPDEAQAYESRVDIVADGHGYLSPRYLVVHSTANPGASAANHVSYWSNSPAYAVHYVMDLDGSVVYQTMSTSSKAWHVGGGNSVSYGIELCEATTAEDFEAQWSEAVKWCGDQLMSRGWDVSRLYSHDEARVTWGGTDHTDPTGYFARFGHSWAEFESDVAAYMGSGAVPDIDAAEGGSAASGSVSGYTDAGFAGAYTCNASALHIRKGPGTGYAAYGDMYYRGERVTLDGWYAIANGYVWGRYTSWSGSTCYVAVGPWTGKAESSDYLVKGGASSGGSSRGAGWYEVDASALNVRTGPSTGYRVTGQLPDGYDLYVSGWSGDWAYYTTYSGATRYVCGDYLDAA